MHLSTLGIQYNLLVALQANTACMKSMQAELSTVNNRLAILERGGERRGAGGGFVMPCFKTAEEVVNYNPNAEERELFVSSKLNVQKFLFSYLRKRL